MQYNVMQKSFWRFIVGKAQQAWLSQSLSVCINADGDNGVLLSQGPIPLMVAWSGEDMGNVWASVRDNPYVPIASYPQGGLLHSMDVGSGAVV